MNSFLILPKISELKGKASSFLDSAASEYKTAKPGKEETPLPAKLSKLQSEKLLFLNQADFSAILSINTQINE